MHARGFTIIELVTILVIVGALSVFVIPRLDITGFDRFGFRQEVMSAARYAQKTAMASGCDVQLQASDGADTVSLFYRSGGDDTSCGGGGFTDPVQKPGAGGDFVVSAPSGVGIASGGTLFFDEFGSPDSAAGLTITLDDGSSLTIEAVTGYAHG